MEVATADSGAAACLVTVRNRQVEHDRLLDAAVNRLARDTVSSYVRKRRLGSMDSSSIARPVPVRFADQSEQSFKSGHKRRGLLPRIHQVVDQVALTHPPGVMTEKNSKQVCQKCDAVCGSVDLIRSCKGSCGAVAHWRCLPTDSKDWYCNQWYCQVQYRTSNPDNAHGKPSETTVVSESVQTLNPEHPRKPPPTSSSDSLAPAEEYEYPGTKAWRIINSYFEPIHDKSLLSALDISAPVSSSLYDVPTPQVHYRDLWEDEDKAVQSGDHTPRSMRYLHRADSSTGAPFGQLGDLRSTSGLVTRVSFYLNINANISSHGDRQGMIASLPNHWAFRCLDMQYAVAAALIQPAETQPCDQFSYMFPPPLYEPLSARFYLSGAPSPFDRKAGGLESPSVNVDSIVNDVGSLQHGEDDDEICCELWLLRRQLEAQIKKNNAIKSYLLQLVEDEKHQTSYNKSIEEKKTTLNAYTKKYPSQRLSELVPEVPSPTQMERGEAISSDPVPKQEPNPRDLLGLLGLPRPDSNVTDLPEVTDLDRALAVASEPHAHHNIPEGEPSKAPPFTLPHSKPTPMVSHRFNPTPKLKNFADINDLCRLIAERHVLMSRAPPTLATIVDFISTDLVLDRRVVSRDVTTRHLQQFERMWQQQQQRTQKQQGIPRLPPQAQLTGALSIDDSKVVQEVVRNLVENVALDVQRGLLISQKENIMNRSPACSIPALKAVPALPMVDQLSRAGFKPTKPDLISETASELSNPHLVSQPVPELSNPDMGSERLPEQSKPGFLSSAVSGEPPLKISYPDMGCEPIAEQSKPDLSSAPASREPPLKISYPDMDFEPIAEQSKPDLSSAPASGEPPLKISSEIVQSSHALHPLNTSFGAVAPSPVRSSPIPLTERPSYILNDPVQFCFCSDPDDLTRWFISCDICENWFHGNCVGFADDLIELIDQFICQSCVRRSRRRTVMRQQYLGYLYSQATRFLDAKSLRTQGRLQKERQSLEILSTLRIRLRKCPVPEGESAAHVPGTICLREVRGIYVSGGIKIDIADPTLLPDGIALSSSTPELSPLTFDRHSRAASSFDIKMRSCRFLSSTPSTPHQSPQQRASRESIESGSMISAEGRVESDVPLRRSQREASQWATTLNRMRDMDSDYTPELELIKKRRRPSKPDARRPRQEARRIIMKSAEGVTLSVNGIRLGRPPKYLTQQPTLNMEAPPPKRPKHVQYVETTPPSSPPTRRGLHRRKSTRLSNI